MMQRQQTAAFIAIFVLLPVVATGCIETLHLAPCGEEKGGCGDGMECRKGRCFNIVPAWEVPPCSSPVAKGRCCDMEQTVIPDNGDCRLPLLVGADAISVPSLGLDGPDEVTVVAVREGTKLSVVAVRSNGSEAWQELVEIAFTGAPSIVRVAGDGRAFMDRGGALWTRSPEGTLTTLPVDGQIDGGFAVCKGGVAVAMVRGVDGRGVVRLDGDIGDWPLDHSLDVQPALPPAISIHDNAVVTAWNDGNDGIIMVHDLSTGELRGSWPKIDSDPEPEITSLAVDGDGHLWVSTANSLVRRLSIPEKENDPFSTGYILVDLETPIHTPPVLNEDCMAVIALGDGRVFLGNDLFSITDPLIKTPLITTAPGTLALLEGGGLQLLGDCPDGRCLSIFFQDSTSFFYAAFEHEGEHRHSGLSVEAATGLPGKAGLAALVMDGRLDGLVVAAPARADSPWPGPDGGPGNGRCAEGTQ